MTKQAIIERTIKILNQLPVEKAQEISDFAAFVMKIYEKQKLAGDIQQIISESKSFGFLNNEEEIYTIADLKEKYIRKE